MLMTTVVTCLRCQCVQELIRKEEVCIQPRVDEEGGGVRPGVVCPGVDEGGGGVRPAKS